MSKTKLNITYTEKLLIFLLYYQKNVSKYEFWTRKNVLAEKDLLEKASTIERFEYSPLGKAFEKQTKVIKKQTEVLNNK